MSEENKEKDELQVVRGTYHPLDITATNKDGSDYTFKVGDVVRIRVYEKKNLENTVLKKDVKITEETTTAQIILEKEDTLIGNPISKSVVYWYEIELNPDTKPQMIIGYEYDEEKKEDVPKIFRLLPKGCDKE